MALTPELAVSKELGLVTENKLIPNGGQVAGAVGYVLIRPLYNMTLFLQLGIPTQAYL